MRSPMALAASLLILTAGVARAEGPAPSPSEMVRGNPKARLVVVEYASLGCSHCIEWANGVFPAFKKKYIDTGKVRFVFREMLTGNGTLAAAGFLTARCAAPGKYFQVVDEVFTSQDALAKEGVEAMARIAEHAGVARPQFNACLQDSAALTALQDRTLADARANNITGTPTFFVNAQRLDGEQTLQQLDAAIAKAKR